MFDAARLENHKTKKTKKTKKNKLWGKHFETRGQTFFSGFGFFGFFGF